MGKIKICVDAGHGSNTGGKRTCKLTRDLGEFKKGEQIREHWINVYVGIRLAKILEKLGYEVFKSAWDDANVKDDTDVPLSTRQKAIKNAKCDYSVSIHLNASGDGVSWNSGNGTEVLIHNNTSKIGDSKELAEYVLSELIKGTKQTNRGVKTMELAMCNCNSLGTKAAILVECAFMTNLNEVEKMITQEDFWDECAEEIATGIDKYIKSKSHITTVPKSNVVAKAVETVKNTVVKKKTGYVKVLAETLNVRNKPTWIQDDVCGVVKKGDIFTVKEKVSSGFYLLKSGLYITSSDKYVEYYEK